MKFLLFFSLIFATSLSFADYECKNFYQCLKEGDRASDKNDFLAAEGYYKKACDMGFKVGCTSLEFSLKEKNKLQTDPEFAKKIAAQNIVDACAEENSDSKDCLQKARQLRIDGNFEESIRIQRQFCSEGNSQACYEAGVSELKVENKDSVENAFAAFECLEGKKEKEACLEQAEKMKADGYISQAQIIEKKFSERSPASIINPIEFSEIEIQEVTIPARPENSEQAP